MMKPSAITQWLMQPANFSENDRKEAAALIKTYPYFVPARYIEAAEHHKKQPMAPALLNMMHLFMGNWLLLHEFLQSSVKEGADAQSPELMMTGTEEYPAADDELPLTDEDIDSDNYDIAETEDPETVHSASSLDVGIQEESEPSAHLDHTDEIASIEQKPKEKVNVTDSETEARTEEPDPVLSPEKEKDLLQNNTPENATPAQSAGVTAEPQPATEDTISAVGDTVKTEKTTEEPPTPEIPPVVPKKEKKAEIPVDQIPFYQNRKADSLIQPIFTEDYFLHQGLQVSDQLSANHQHKEKDKSLMVVMSFSEWLLHFKTKGEREKEEQEDQKALKTMWQKEKLAAALEEENEEIPETVFEMAVNSIAKEEDLASESLAEIMVKQGKTDKAIDMYRKLSLRNPQKKTYFARKIEDLQKDKES